jgi:WhiB family transcriptional regulator, redox-sensing transcriptional regulator
MVGEGPGNCLAGGIALGLQEAKSTVFAPVGPPPKGLRAMTLQTDDWTLQAKCRGLQDELFPDGAEQKRARTVCGGCPVRGECLAEALDNRIEWGVWGGMTERERRRLLRQRTDITSWTTLLCPDKRSSCAS